MINSVSTSCFSLHNIFVDENGDVFSFGTNTDGSNSIFLGQCGTGSSNEENILKPTKIMNNPNIISIVLGLYHSFYLEKNGDLYGCGLNEQGQLGIKDDKENKDKFVFVCSNIKKICASEYFTIIQKENGKIFWSGRWDKLDKNSNGFSKEIKIEDAVSFSCGGDHCLFLKENGEVWVIGSNEYGQCGFEDNKSIYQPTFLLKDENIISVCCGYNHSFILTRNENGKTLLKCFGCNGNGELGLNHKNNQFGIATIDSFPNISSVHCSGEHSFILTDGEVYGCGNNPYGQLSLGNNSSVSVFTKIKNLPKIIQITTGAHHSIFLGDKKEIFVCGRGEFGQLGLGDTNNKNVATKLEFKNLKIFQNLIHSQKTIFPVEIEFIFEMKVEGGEMKKENILQKIEKNVPIKEMVEKIFEEKNNFGFDVSQTKFILLKNIQINNKILQKEKYNEKYFEWEGNNNNNKNVVLIVFELPYDSNLLKKTINENLDLKKEKNDFVKEKEEKMNDLKKEIVLKDEIIVDLKKKCEKMVVLEEKVKNQVKKVHSFSFVSPPKTENEKDEKEYIFVKEINENHKCFVCKEVMEDPMVCSGECNQFCCKKCCIKQTFCPNKECILQEMEPSPGKKKTIENLMVKCSHCQKEMKKIEIEKHLEEHLFECRWKNLGCKEKEKKCLISLHENDCPFFLEFQKKQKEDFFPNFLVTFKEYNN